MRCRALVAVGVLLLPSVSDAQFRLPRIGSGRGVPAAAPLPPQPRIVGQALAYNRMRVSYEAYPMMSFFNTGDFAGNGQTSWATAGLGTRLDYRVARLTSLTLDLTSTVIGGPVFAESAELGFRFGPRREEHRAYGFVDVRSGYFMTFNQSTTLDDFGIAPVAPTGGGIAYSEGFGGLVGAGMEFALTRRFSMTTAASLARGRMTSVLDSRSSPGEKYSLTSYRYVISLRYNGVRFTNAPNTTTQH